MSSRTCQITVALLLIVVFTLACNRLSPSNEQSIRVRSEMQNIRQTTNTLYGFVWEGSTFKQPTSEDEINKLLRKLVTNFHDLEDVSYSEAADPGFRVALRRQKTLLAKAQQYFIVGVKDEARRRLLLASSNCVVCHTRYQLPTNFLSNSALEEPSDLQAAYRSAERELALRQFSKASHRFYDLAQRTLENEDRSSLGYDALLHWLLIQVRVKNDPAAAIDGLHNLGEVVRNNEYLHDITKAWISDLEKLRDNPPPAHPLLREARSLLDFTNDPKSSEDKMFVRTLRATSVLHNYLRGQPTLENRREASLLLAIAYGKLPIPTLRGLQELFLEEVINEFPGSFEAMQAFRIYKDLCSAIYGTENDRILLTKQAEEHLEQLKELAFQKEPLEDSH